jgi:hypothetical protein
MTLSVDIINRDALNYYSNMVYCQRAACRHSEAYGIGAAESVSEFASTIGG